MPPCFDRRIRIHNGKIIAETVSLFDPDAALYWRFDAACHTPRGLRNLVVIMSCGMLLSRQRADSRGNCARR